MISVIIVSFNRKMLLQECLHSLFSQQYAHPYEIIVVDNASSDGTVNFVLPYIQHHPVALIRLDRERGLSECKNIGLRKARGQLIAFTDDDCLVEPGWLASIQRDLSDHDVIYGSVVARKGVRFPGWWRGSMNWIVGISQGVFFQPAGRVNPIGSNIAFRREVLHRLRGFDERISRIHGNMQFMEDLDIVARSRGGGI